MIDPRKRLIDFVEPSDRPSVLFAKKILRSPLELEESIGVGISSILDGYQDQGYAPSTVQIEEWVSRETGAMRQVLTADAEAVLNDIMDEQSGFMQNFHSALDRNAKGELDSKQLTLTLATAFSWMDRSPFWSGTPLESYWHAAKAQAALLKIHQNSSAVVM